MPLLAADRGTRRAHRTCHQPRRSGHAFKADDSDGLIGDLARTLLDIHASACDAGVADPIKLSRWMIRFTFEDQDFFTADPVRYAAALGEPGLAAYRHEVRQRVEAGNTYLRGSRAGTPRRRRW